MIDPSVDIGAYLVPMQSSNQETRELELSAKKQSVVIVNFFPFD
jgi:hypothetical protein